tara:strand:+ start:234 stop:653 length:420 start_codon:yes stop_codon:yes gene_type:complete
MSEMFDKISKALIPTMLAFQDACPITGVEKPAMFAATTLTVLMWVGLWTVYGSLITKGMFDFLMVWDIILTIWFSNYFIQAVMKCNGWAAIGVILFINILWYVITRLIYYGVHGKTNSLLVHGISADEKRPKRKRVRFV